MKLFNGQGQSIEVFENTRDLKVGDRVVVINENGIVINDYETGEILTTEIYEIREGEMEPYNYDLIKTDLGGWYHHKLVYKIKNPVN